MFKSNYEKLIYYRTYSRWNDKIKKRENWNETCERYENYILEQFAKSDNTQSNKVQLLEALSAINKGEIMPSMRALWTAGPPAKFDNIAIYNCSYMPIESPRCFAEMLYILMNGTGVGYSVERQYISKLPVVPVITQSNYKIEFWDSKRGWAEGYLKFIKRLYNGEKAVCDMSLIRPKGEILKTFGGRASGPEPLKHLLEFTYDIFNNAANRKLNSLEVHDICCCIAACVVVGGVRRSACISLSNLSDDRMATCKLGNYDDTHPYRAFANNSVAFTEKPEEERFLKEWLNLVESKRGERGIFNRVAATIAAINTGRRKTGYEFGTNPCGETILRPYGLCNLTSVIIRPDDTKEILLQKVRDATIIGCVQSTFTDFKFVSRKWKKNAEEERLLGVSLTGLRDHKVLRQVSKTAERWLHQMKMEAIETANIWASILNINVPAAITLIKPEGTVSQMLSTASGVHPRFAPYYIRRMTISANDPLSKMLIDQGFKPIEITDKYNGQLHSYIFEFPTKSPESSIMNEDVSAIDQLEYWKMIKNTWCEHNPSVTIHVKDGEWVGVGSWVYDNWDIICGLTFMPEIHGYQYPPYEEIDEDTFNNLHKNMPIINFNNLADYESSDRTEGAKEYACTGGGCEI